MEKPMNIKLTLQYALLFYKQEQEKYEDSFNLSVYSWKHTKKKEINYRCLHWHDLSVKGIYLTFS